MDVGIFRRPVRKGLMMAMAAPAALLAVTGAMADEAPARQAVIEEVVVTANRRETNLQETPLSITALTGDQLEKAGIQDTTNLQFVTPGLVFSTNTVIGQPYIRGVGTEILTIGADSSVAMHLDGVYMARPVALVQELLDVERVEVLRGPQGTLYGRNATGGAINVISKRPRDEFSAEGNLLAGNYGRLRATAIVNLPLGEKAALRVAGLRSISDGYFRIVPGKQRSENTDVSVIRGQLLLKPTDTLEFIVGADYSDDDGDRGIAAKLDTRMSLPVLALGAQLPPGPRELRVNRPIDARLKQGGASLTVNWSPGGVTAKSITAWRESHMDLLIDLDWTEIDFVTDDAHEDSETFTQEFQLASDGDGPLEWIVGAFALHEEASQEFDVGITPIRLRLDPLATNEATAYGIYGQGTYSITERLRGTVGLRFSTEKKSFVVDRSNNRPLPPPQLQHERGTHSWSDWTPRFGAEYDVADDIMVFASASKGFKSGGTNTSSLSGPTETFDPETVWSYELGVKSYFWDRRLRFNATAFHYEFKDIQINARDPATGVTKVFNGAAASGDGLEVDTTALLAPGLELNVGLALLDAKWDELRTSNPDSATPNVIQNFAGNRLLRAPKLGLNIGVQYSFDAFGGSVVLNGGYRYQSKVYFNQFENILVGQPAYALVDARAEYRTEDGRLGFAVFGNNLTDKLYRTNVIRSSGVYGSGQFWGPPRTYGVQMSVRY